MSIKFSGEQTLDINKLEKEKGLRDVGSQAVWSLSSCKSGFGIDQLIDSSSTSYWQSDDGTPHYINIQFKRKMLLSDICLYMDYKNDESYTPNKISIRAGSHHHDLTEIELIEMSEPNGWVYIPLKDRHDRMIRAFMIQIMVTSNHQNGKDTHLRRVTIHSPLNHTDFTTSGKATLKPFSETAMNKHPFSIR